MSRKRISREDMTFNTVNIIIMLLILVITLYPLYFILIASISNPTLVNSGQVWLYPREITMIGLKRLFTEPKIWLGYRNTVFISVAGVAINLFVTVPAAYTLSRKDFESRKFIMFLFTFTMFFSGGMIPTYLTVRNMHMLNTYWALFIPSAFSVWNLIVARSFFLAMPVELQEAAQVDGCSNTRLFLSIILPLAKPMIAVISLYYLVGHWNGFFDALIYLSNQKKYPLQIFLREILIQASTLSMAGSSGGDASQLEELMDLSNLIKYSAVIVSCLPLLIIYPFIQKYFVKGVMIGSIKG